ncbi:MAG: hypothetical protein U0930_04820 [Pirellulales bacterium]
MDTATATTAIQSTNSLLSNRSDAMVILVGLIVLAAFWLWKIQLPRLESERKLREADKEIHRTNSETLAKLSTLTEGIHQTTNNSLTTIHAMVEVKEIELDCITEIADKTECDVREKIAEAKGVLRAVRAGVTS